MRELVVDTETTGLDPLAGDRLVELACVELINHIPTGQTFQTYLNPERDMPPDAFAIHGLSAEFLADKPLFGVAAGKFLEFIAGDPLVIHNAEFDLKFINAELATAGRALLPYTRVVDTLAMARRKFPGSPASLDALCKRYSIDTARREKHGALLDAELLAQVYIELIGGRQPGLELAATAGAGLTTGAAAPGAASKRGARPPRPHMPSAEELAAHEAFVAALADPIWRK